MVVICKKDWEHPKLEKFIKGEIYVLTVVQNMLAYWIKPNAYQQISVEQLEEYFTKFDF